MSSFLSFVVGLPCGFGLAVFLLYCVVDHLGSTPHKALETLAAVLRAFAGRLPGILSVVIDVEGRDVHVPFEVVAQCIERGRVRRDEPDRSRHH